MARPRGVSNVLPRLSTCMLTYSSSWESGSDGGKRSAQAKDIDIDLCLIGSGSASSLLEDDGASAVTRFDEREHRPGGIMSPYSAGGLRLLAPAHSGQGAHSSSNSSSSSGGGAGPARAKKASTACSACQRRRSKCIGGPPCEKCVAHQTECVVDETLDQRRKVTAKRKAKELEYDRALLGGLLETIRGGDETQVAQVVHLIRSGASMREVTTYIDEQLDVLRRKGQARSRASVELEQTALELLRLQRGGGGDGPGQLAPNVRRKVMSVQRLSDRPFINVPAKPWTTVTDDSDFVSHLISLWFTWHYPYFHWVDREPFLADMRAGRLGSRYCSPFLVNVLLAEACPYSDYPEACAVPGDQSSAGAHFCAEAKKWLEAEEGRVSITSVQGSVSLYAYMMMSGKDRLGWLHLKQTVHMMQELDLARKAGLPHPESDESVRKMQKARDITAWGAFSIITMSSMAIQKPQQLKPPSRLRHPDDHAEGGVEWSPYPQHGVPIHTHTGCLFNQLCCLGEISAATNELLFAEGGRPPVLELEHGIESLYDRLQGWYGQIPDCLHLGERPPPHVLCLHMHYHDHVMTIFGFLKPLLQANFLTATAARARQLCVSSALEVARLVEVLRCTWGLDRILIVMTQCITVAIFTLMEDLEPAQHRAAFTELCVAARAFSRRWVLGNGMMILYQATAQQMGITLPSETAAIFKDFEEGFRKADGRQTFSSAYPSFGASVKGEHTGPRDVMLDDMLEKWDHLEVERGYGENGSSSSSPEMQPPEGEPRSSPDPTDPERQSPEGEKGSSLHSAQESESPRRPDDGS